MKPKTDDNHYSLNLRLPDGKVQNWVFNKNSEVLVWKIKENNFLEHI